MTFAFVFRRMMDIDHMLPIAVALHEAGHAVRLGVMGNDVKLTRDPRLVLFNERPPIWKLVPPFAAKRCSAFLYGVRCLAMDWVKADKLLTRTLTDIAPDRGIPSVALPHGVHLVADPAYYRNRIRPGMLDHFDHVVVPNHIIHDAHIAAGRSQSRIHILGAPRLTADWINRLAAIYPARERSDNGRLKVAYFDQAFHDGARLNETIETLNRLKALPFADLAIQLKPISDNPRRYALNQAFRDNLCQHHSSALCAWADVVLTTSSSAALEAHVRGKHLIWAKYLDIHDLLYETAGGSWIAHNYCVLRTLLETIHSNPTMRPYCEDEFKRNILWGGNNERAVLPSYIKFMTGLAGLSVHREDSDYNAAGSRHAPRAGRAGAAIA